MENQYTRRQNEIIVIAANASGQVDNEILLDSTYSRVVGVTVYNKGVHTNYNIGLKRSRGAQIEDIIPFEHFSQNQTERFLPTNFSINNDKIVVQTLIDAQENNELRYKIVFTLEK
ncbi:hypothetical protein [Roseivirga seohaensis]|uniref:hypothetical protein n=1 Tax=Roseivirga seohaensis TaxID=1914963 RepID=UPI003BA981A4